MLATLTSTWLSSLVLATESGIPASHAWAKLAVPIGIAIFVGSTYLLLRSNLGTRRGYLVLGTALWGFTFILALFWTFGAPGTPAATGPQTLPGQQLNEYEPTWYPFAGDSQVAGRPEYAAVKSYPDGFGPPPESFAEQAVVGAEEIGTFFTADVAEGPDARQALFTGDFELDEATIVSTTATNGFPVVAATYRLSQGTIEEQQAIVETQRAALLAADPTYTEEELLAAVPDYEIPEVREYTLFAFFDKGNPIFPSLLVAGIVAVLFALHTVLLARDEAREKRERASDAIAEREPVEAGV